MANGTYPFPLSGGVDLDGKPFQIAEGNLRKMQNVIPDKIGNPVRRPSMQALYPLSTTGGDACENAELHGYLDPAISPKDFNSVPPLWLSVPPMDGGFFIFGTASGSNRLDLTVSASDQFGGGARAVNCLMSAPSLLPSSFAKLGAQYIVYGPNPYGSSGLKIYRGEEDAITIEDFVFEGTGNTNVAPRLACEHQDRFAFGNFGDEGDAASTIIFSDIDEPLVIGNDALSNRSIIVGFRDGQKLKAIHSVMAAAAGTPAQSMLLALKTKSAYLLVGEPEETDSTDDPRGSLQVNKISGTAGCVSQASVCDTPYGTIWCGPDDVWFMPFGAVPIPIGRKLRPLLLAQPESAQFRIHAVFDKGFYKLALFSDGQGPDNTAPLGEQWWLDLRGGPPEDWTSAKWCGPQIFKPLLFIATVRDQNNTAESGISDLMRDNGTNFMAVDYREGANGRLYGAQFAQFPTLENDGGLTTVLVVYDGNSARDWAAFFRSAMRPWQRSSTYHIGDEIVVWPPSAGDGVNSVNPYVFVVSETADVESPQSGTTEPDWESGVIIVDNEVTWTLWGACASPASGFGNEILTAVQTRESDLGTRMVEKLFLGAELAVFLTTPECIRLTQLVDAGKTTDEINQYILGTSGPVLGSAIFGVDMPAFTEEVLTEAFWTDENSRTVGKSAQLTFEEIAGVVLPVDPTFTIIIGGEPYYLTLASRYFETVMALADAVVAALNASQEVADAGVDGFNVVGGTPAAAIAIDAGGNWAPGVTTDESRFIWSLLGFTAFTGVEASLQIGDEVPYDVALGNIGYVEAVVHFRPFKRRPL
jgi:hypothetical protein